LARFRQQSRCSRVWKNHRNLRTRRRLHSCMQDDQIAPAEMARVPHLITTKIVFSSKRPSPAGTGIVHFWQDILLLFLDFYGKNE
jgi:hypothetical protein